MFLDLIESKVKVPTDPCARRIWGQLWLDEIAVARADALADCNGLAVIFLAEFETWVRERWLS